MQQNFIICLPSMLLVVAASIMRESNHAGLSSCSMEQQGSQLQPTLPHVLPELLPAIGKPLNNHLQTLYGRRAANAESGDGMSRPAVPETLRYDISVGFRKVSCDSWTADIPLCIISGHQCLM